LARPVVKDGRVIVRGQTKTGRSSLFRSGLEIAEINARQAFIEYCVLQEIKLPEAWESLRGQITRELSRSLPEGVTITGMTVLEKNTGGEGAYCILSIPVENVGRVGERMNLADAGAVLDRIRGNPCLYYEAARRLGKKPGLDIILGEVEGDGFNILGTPAGGGIPDRVPEIWLETKNNEMDGWLVEMRNTPAPDADDMRDIPPGEFSRWLIISSLQVCAGLEDIRDLLCKELARLNYDCLARDLAAIKLPVSQKLNPREAGLEDVYKEAVAEADGGMEVLFRVVARNKGCLLFKPGSTRSKILQKAVEVFAQAPVDLEKTRALAVASLSEGMSSEAFNLIGRALELQGKLRLAACFYTQAYVLDEENPYATANLALVFDKINRPENSVYWTSRASKNPKLSAWARAQLAGLKKKRGGK
jgi:tetratricopeptide (TPR) repeat protein